MGRMGRMDGRGLLALKEFKAFKGFLEQAGVEQV
jgi:hypothetical protein